MPEIIITKLKQHYLQAVVAGEFDPAGAVTIVGMTFGTAKNGCTVNKQHALNDCEMITRDT